MYVIVNVWRQVFERFKIFFNTRKREFVRVDGIFKKITTIEEEEVEGEGVIQVETLKIVNKIPELPSKSNKCNMSPSKSDKCFSSSSKLNN